MGLKILFTCIGRRVELVQRFKAAAKKLNKELLIYATDVTMTAPAIYFCDKGFIAPQIDSENYISFLFELCEREKVDAIIPTIDMDLLLLAEHKKEFLDKGIKVLVPNADKVAICRDKTVTSNYFLSLGLNAPFAVGDVEEYSCGFPAFIKPKDGSSSINAFKVNNKEELEAYAKKIKDYVVQPFVQGVEYTVDIFCDFNGKPIFITPRIRLAVRAGEVLKTQINQNDEIVNEMLTLVKDFKPCGGITVQLIRDEEKKINWYIEINPRFGGGAPLSMMAGADSSEAVLKLLSGENVMPDIYAADDGAVFSRFDQSIRIN